MSTELSTSKYLEEARLQNPEPKAQRGTRQKWPTGLTIVCALFAIASLFGSLSAAHGFYKLNQPPPQMERPKTAAEKQMKKVLDAQVSATQKYFPMLVYNEIMKLIVAGGLMFCAAYLFSKNPQARKFAVGICGLALFYHVCSLGISILMISETGAAVGSLLSEGLANMDFESDEHRGKTEEVIQNQLLSWVTMGVAIAFLVKLMFYGGILAYLWTDEIKDIFGEDSLAYLERENAEAAAKNGIPDPNAT